MENHEIDIILWFSRLDVRIDSSVEGVMDKMFECFGADFRNRLIWILTRGNNEPPYEYFDLIGQDIPQSPMFDVELEEKKEDIDPFMDHDPFANDEDENHSGTACLG